MTEQRAFAVGRARGEADAALRVAALANFLQPEDNEDLKDGTRVEGHVQGWYSAPGPEVDVCVRVCVCVCV